MKIQAALNEQFSHSQSSNKMGHK